MEELVLSSGSDIDSTSTSPSTPGLTPDLERQLLDGEVINGVITEQPRSDYIDDDNTITTTDDDLYSNSPTVPRTESLTPPPTYADCMKKAIPLSFMDFWPQCLNLDDAMFMYAKFEPFDVLIDAANSWLQDQSDIVVRNCETVEIKVTSMDEYQATTSAKPTVYRSRYQAPLFVKGLRVWYSSAIVTRMTNTACSFAETPCRISYRNIQPDPTTCENEEVKTSKDCEKFTRLTEKANEMIRNGKMAGRILNAETVYVKESNTGEDDMITVNFDPDQTSWRDRYHKIALQFLRIYYLPEIESNELEMVRHKDFLPVCLRRSKHNPKYTNFTDIMDDARVWLLQQSQNFRFLNAQTINTKYPGHKNNLQPDASSTLHIDFETVPRVRFLRIYYTLSPAIEYDCEENYMVPLLSHRTFVPAALKRRHHENMGPLMRRVEHWLRATEASVVCAETLPLLEQDYHHRGEIDSNVFRTEWLDGDMECYQQTLLYVVRVYLDTVYPEPLDKDDDDLDEECVIL